MRDKILICIAAICLSPIIISAILAAVCAYFWMGYIAYHCYTRQMWPGVIFGSICQLGIIGASIIYYILDKKKLEEMKK